MTDHPEAKLLTILERQGYRELVAAHLFAGGVRMAPSIDEKQMLVQHSAEELAHFELVAALYEQVCGRSLYEVIAARTESFPGAASWPELVVAAYLVDHAAAVQLEAYRAFGDARLDRLVRKILDHEHEHQTAAETALVDHCQGSPEHRELARSYVANWYPLARDVTDGAQDVLAAFARSSQATLRKCGLDLPDAPG